MSVRKVNVPAEFQPRIKVAYPPHNQPIFEEWLYDKIESNEMNIPGDRVYLPVFWTSFYVNNDYGKGWRMGNLQAFIDSLDRTKKYFTVLQYDDGILTDLKDLDIVVFGSGGGRIDVPIPLVCMPHTYSVGSIPRKYLASFIGSITHPIRQTMIDTIKALPPDQQARYYISTDHHDIDTYCKIMRQSVFALCPRGYGKTSFRICEALQYGAVPVYISDEFIFPFDIEFDEIGNTLEPHNVKYLHRLLTTYWDKMSEMVDDDVKAGQHVYHDMYKFEGLGNKILAWLKHS